MPTKLKKDYSERKRFIKAGHLFFLMETHDCYCDYCNSDRFAIWQTDDPNYPEETCYACDKCLKRLKLPYTKGDKNAKRIL